jgi:hypothetical protein
MTKRVLDPDGNLSSTTLVTAEYRAKNNLIGIHFLGDLAVRSSRVHRSLSQPIPARVGYVAVCRSAASEIYWHTVAVAFPAMFKVFTAEVLNAKTD